MPNNPDHLLLLLGRKALVALLHHAIQQPQIIRPQVRNHQHFALRQPVRPQAGDQGAEGGGAVGGVLVARDAGAGGGGRGEIVC